MPLRKTLPSNTGVACTNEKPASTTTPHRADTHGSERGRFARWYVSTSKDGGHISADLNPNFSNMHSSCSAASAGRLNGASVMTRWQFRGLILSTFLKTWSRMSLCRSQFTTYPRSTGRLRLSEEMSLTWLISSAM